MTFDKKNSIFTFLVFIAYLFIVIWFTILSRQVSFHVAQPELFWSYKLWFAGNWDYGLEIFCNIFMFIPFGYLLSTIIKNKYNGIINLTSAFLFSLIIESLQLVLMRGLFEWDDVINNVFGSALGWLLYVGIKIIASRKYILVIQFAINTIFLIASIGLLVFKLPVSEETEDESSKHYCFQIDEVKLKNGSITMTGFEFIYGKNPEKIDIILKSEDSGKIIFLNTIYGLERSEINGYFRCDYDYTNVGFSAAGIIDETEEYEVLIKYSWSVAVPTGVYISGERIHFFKDSDVIEPVGLDDLLNNSHLLVYRPDYHCWIYQKDGCLYWIADEDFDFEDDGSTYIQYQLWTTQVNNLPDRRKEKNLNWDNIGSYFEDYELLGNYGPYRIMKRNLPSAYSITSIETGYYVDGKWIWKEYFRPIYEI